MKIQLAIVLIILISGCIQKTVYESPEPFKVIKVIDGDTIEINTGEKIRLMGIDTPEDYEKCYKESTEKLEEFVLYKNVILEKDVINKDKYGRLLRYLRVGNISVNLEMIKSGYAYIFKYNDLEFKYYNLFLEAENFARENKLGCLWK